MMLLAVFWIVLLFNRSTAGIAIGINAWMLGACLFLVVMGRLQSAAIVSGARVLRQQRTPQPLWRTWLRTSMADTQRIWGILALAGTALLLVPESPWQWSSAVVLFSVTLSLSMVATLSNHGLFHRAWAWVITVGGLLSVLWVVMTIGLADGLNQLAQAPFILHGLLAVSWPLLAYRFTHTWQQKPPVSLANHGEKSYGLGAYISNFASRYTVLMPGGRNRMLDDRFRNSPVLSLVGTAGQGFLFPLIALQWLAVPWSDNIYPYHFLGLGLFSLYTVPYLVCKDLHWRQLLAPGGLHHGRLGWSIFRATLALQMTGASIFAGIGIVAAWIAFEVPPARILAIAWNYRVFPMELIFATSLMCVLRAAGGASFKSAIVVFTSYIVALLAFGGAMYWSFRMTPGPTLFLADSAYLCGLLIATTAMVLLSNRLWTVKKLLPCLRLR